MSTRKVETVVDLWTLQLESLLREDGLRKLAGCARVVHRPRQEEDLSMWHLLQHVVNIGLCRRCGYRDLMLIQTRQSVRFGIYYPVITHSVVAKCGELLRTFTHADNA